MKIAHYLHARKTADENRASTVALADDPDLLLPIGANEWWLYLLLLHYSAAATGDLKFAIQTAVDSGAAGRYGALGLGSSVAADPGDVTAPSSSTLFGSGGVGIGGTGTGSNRSFLAYAFIRNGATPTNVLFRWAQLASDVGNTAIRSDSLMLGVPIV